MQVPRDPLREALAVWLSVMGGLAALTLLGGAVPVVAQFVGALAVSRLRRRWNRCR